MFIGIDIGGTKCAAVRGERTGDGLAVAERLAFETAGLTPAAAIAKFDDAVRRLSRGETPEAIGLSCGGPLDSGKGVILSPPNLPGWDNVEIVRHFHETFGVPAKLVNDANASALAEWKYGAGKGTRNMIFLTFGTGLGAGLILNGALYEGASGMAGEVGHIRLDAFGPAGYGKCGSFEGFCSGAGLAALARETAREALQRGICPAYLPGGDFAAPLTAKTVAEAARDGDETALSVFRVCGEKLGAGLAVLMDAFNPEAIVIGSVFVRCRDLLWPHAEHVIRAEALAPCAAVCRVLPAKLGEQIGDYAALAAASEAVYDHTASHS